MNMPSMSLDEFAEEDTEDDSIRKEKEQSEINKQMAAADLS